MRNKLALERTRLANERTFLAYVRTGLSLLAAAVVLLEFFASKSAYVPVAYALGSTGLFVLLVGIFRFRKVRSDLNKPQPSDSDQSS